MTGRLKQNIGPTLELLAARWPKCFSVFEGRRKPLKVGIDLDVVAELDGVITPAELGLALKIYTSNQVYRRRLVAGAVRIGLDGMPAGIVTPEQVPAPARTAPPVNTSRSPAGAPKRLSFADLREAARARKAVQS